MSENEKMFGVVIASIVGLLMIIILLVPFKSDEIKQTKIVEENHLNIEENTHVFLSKSH
ncbi:hypothetical protein [Flammeovirga sp. SubArs3]|uniref:hypothetical protein n=1 Tax=Flammeovirga sp. SubArs3 TaxID=2995316 RepID=UPI00248C76FF|nr:hypothetical protein [Flammeovirga sp. SubArs3]